MSWRSCWRLPAHTGLRELQGGDGSPSPSTRFPQASDFGEEGAGPQGRKALGKQPVSDKSRGWASTKRLPGLPPPAPSQPRCLHLSWDGALLPHQSDKKAGTKTQICTQYTLEINHTQGSVLSCGCCRSLLLQELEEDGARCPVRPSRCCLGRTRSDGLLSPGGTGREVDFSLSLLDLNSFHQVFGYFPYQPKFLIRHLTLTNTSAPLSPRYFTTCPWLC